MESKILLLTVCVLILVVYLLICKKKKKKKKTFGCYVKKIGPLLLNTNDDADD